jgi:Quinolinate phosphoribosyl transferase, N-terminal domain
VSADPPDRGTVVAAIMPGVLAVRLDTDDDAVGGARFVCFSGGPCVGMLVVQEIFGRVGVRTRALVEEGDIVGPDQAVAAVGGPLAAIHGVAPLALTWLGRLSAVASGAATPGPDDPLDAWAARLSVTGAVGHDGPSFRVEYEG